MPCYYSLFLMMLNLIFIFKQKAQQVNKLWLNTVIHASGLYSNNQIKSNGTAREAVSEDVQQ